jgi:cysteine desulfurase
MTGAVYMDANATMPICAAARTALDRALDMVGNPSSVHRFGRAARAVVDRARAQVAELAGARPQDVVFVGSGTEANNLAIASRGGRQLIVSGIEHDSVLKPAAAAGAQVLRTLADGRVDLADLERALADADGPAFVSIMLANNETGVLQPVAEASALVHAAGGLLHCDAAQAPGRIAVDLKALGADLMTLSAHKMGGALGAAALVLNGEVALAPQMLGGGQEKFRRAGTENVPAIAAFGAAAEAAMALPQGVPDLRDRLESQLAAFAGITVLGKDAARLPNTSCFAIAGKASETLVMALDLAGFAVSAGAACSSGKVRPSHVATAMGLGAELARSALRVSLGAWNTVQDIDGLVAQLAKIPGLSRRELPGMQPAA